jgi:hypothetical protein
MNQKKYEKGISTFAKAKLGGSLAGVMDNAEVAWKAQRQASSLIDHKNEAVKGEQKLEELLDALTMWIIRLEVLEHDAKEIAKRANKALHERGRSVGDEEDSQGYSDDEISDKIAGCSDERFENEFTRFGNSRRCNDRDRAFGNADSGFGKSINKKAEESFNKGRKVSCGEY